MSGVDKSSLLPSSSQVTSGLVLSSLTGLAGAPFLGQVNVANFCSHWVPGLSCHASWSLIGAPCLVVWGAGADGWAPGVSGSVGCPDGCFDGFLDGCGARA